MTRKLVALTSLLPPLLFFLLPGESSALQTDGKTPLTLDVLFHPERKLDFDGTPPNIVAWLKDGESYIESRGDKESGAKRLLRVDARSGESRPLFDTDAIREAFGKIDGIDEKTAADLAREGEFTFSPDESAVLIEHQGDLYWYRFEDGRASRLTRSPDEEREPSFSPDGQSLAFVRENDLYVVSVIDGRETRLTEGGGKDLLNGVLDWVYQEEIYGRGNFKGYWWSPDSKRIAYLQLDESPVPRFTVIDHVPDDPVEEVTRYPKAGDPNPNPRLGVVAAEGGPTLWLDLGGHPPEDLLIVQVGWTPDGSEVALQTQNKEQTWLDLSLGSPSDGGVRKLFRETTPAWVNVLGEPEWLSNGDFLWLSERSGWSHIYRYANNGELVGALTSGEWEVRRLHGVDEENGWIYFSGTRRDPVSEDLHRVRLDGSEVQLLSDRPGFHRILFNPQFSYHIDAWSDFNTPTQTRLHDSSGAVVRIIDENPSGALDRFLLSPLERVQAPTRDGFMMEALLIKPPDFDPAKKYPVMSHTYAGPHAPRVANRWGGTGYLWHQYLAQQGYIVWICDNRSASGKGAVSTWPVHRNMGELELRDLEDGLQWLKNQPWVDGERIGIWGWSYGGYMTAYALTHSKSFKIGIAGAPVTDWHLYDTVYTERYMGTPQNNPDGYKTSSVVQAAADLHGKLLLLHGTIDDNVHLQNSIQFIHQLQSAGKSFDLMLYPKARHGVRAPRQVHHMRKLMTDFIQRNL